jgi:hypothetical protein
LHDGIIYEQFGKPAVVLCTTPFEVTARNIARMLGLPDYSFALLKHPWAVVPSNKLKAAQQTLINKLNGFCWPNN